ncbi:hypothetical protein ACSBR2_002811 [Camellia fascicularis]
MFFAISSYDRCVQYHLEFCSSRFLQSFTIGMVLLLRGVDGNQYRSWCHYLSCVPTSLWKCKPDRSLLRGFVEGVVDIIEQVMFGSQTEIMLLFFFFFLFFC